MQELNTQISKINKTLKNGDLKSKSSHKELKKWQNINTQYPLCNNVLSLKKGKLYSTPHLLHHRRLKS